MPGQRLIAGNENVFWDRAKTVLQAYLLAAAIHGYDVGALVRWAVSKPPDQEPVKLLHDGGYPELVRNLRAEIGMVAETSDAVWMSVRRVIEPLMDPRLRQTVHPPAGRGLRCPIVHRRPRPAVPHHRAVPGRASSNYGGRAIDAILAALTGNSWLSTIATA